MSSASSPAAPSLATAPCRQVATADDANARVRLRALVESEHAFVWRSVRRLGVAMADVDDAVQKVFLVATKRLAEVPIGRERAFLFATSVRIASNERRGERRKRSEGSEPLDILRSPAPSPEQVASDRALLDLVLEALPIELRSIVVLYELEEMTTEEIGGMLELPAGTIASRIRRARELIESTMKRLHAHEGRHP